MDLSLVPQIAQWTTDQLAELWKNPTVNNVTLGVAAGAIYDVIKRFFHKPAAIGALEEAQAAPQNPDNLQALNLQIEKYLKEDPAFRDELLKLVPQELKLTRITQRQKVGNNSVGTIIAGNRNTVKIQK